MELKELYRLFLSSEGVDTDSRNIRKNTLFFAISGERFDGNSFAGEALDKGAKYAIIDHPGSRTGDRFILVEDALHTLQELASLHRKQLPATFIGLTGSNGKTTSKELMQAVLSAQYKTYATRGNLNNHIGVPLTLLETSGDIEFAIIEMGANHQGEIARLCEIARPEYGVITNIGEAHLEGFGGPEGVVKAKGEIYDHISKHGKTIFRNLDHRALERISVNIPGQITYGSEEKADYPGRITGESPFLQMEFNGGSPYTISSKLLGRYNFENIALAQAVGRHFDVGKPRIKKAIEEYEPRNNRSEVIESGGNKIILDAYNANPTSVKAALQMLVDIQTGNKKMVVLGDMLELGEVSSKKHQEIASLAAHMPIDKLIFIGTEFGKVKNLPGEHYKDRKAFISWLQGQHFSGYDILIKGSRKLNLEAIIEDHDIFS